MKTFESIKLTKRTLSKELQELEKFLDRKKNIKERETIAPFFKKRKCLCAALGITNAAVGFPDRVASELDLFGDFTCDAASGDSQNNSYTLIEFEDATPSSVFKKLKAGKTVRSWSPRFEHGFSQLVDWAWRLDTEGSTSESYRRIFEKHNATINFLLIAGRKSELSQQDIDRITWRASNLSLGKFRMSCLTYDDIISTVRRRLLSLPGQLK